MIKEILLPDLGEGIETVDVSEVLVSPGDNITPGDIILVLESEKASMEIPSEEKGKTATPETGRPCWNQEQCCTNACP